MSILNRRSSTTANIDADIGELIARRSERTAEAEAAEARIAGEVIETGTSSSLKLAESLRREVAGFDRAIAALEQERAVVADAENAALEAKQWRAAEDYGRHVSNRAEAIETLIGQLRRALEMMLNDAVKLRDLIPQLPEGFEFNTLLAGGLLSSVRDQLHGDAFRDRNPGVSVTALVNDYVGLCLRERPNLVRTGTELLLKRPSHDASVKA